MIWPPRLFGLSGLAVRTMQCFASRPGGLVPTPFLLPEPVPVPLPEPPAKGLVPGGHTQRSSNFTIGDGHTSGLRTHLPFTRDSPALHGTGLRGKHSSLLPDDSLHGCSRAGAAEFEAVTTGALFTGTFGVIIGAGKFICGPFAICNGAVLGGTVLAVDGLGTPATDALGDGVCMGATGDAAGRYCCGLGAGAMRCGAGCGGR